MNMMFVFGYVDFLDKFLKNLSYREDIMNEDFFSQTLHKLSTPYYFKLLHKIY